MFFKILAAILVLLGAGYLLAGGRPALPQRRAARAPASIPPAQDLEKCGRSGIWLPAGQRCDCAGRA